jgi:hypothetical protein
MKKTAKVLHHESSHYKGFSISLRSIERKIQNGATMRYFAPKENGSHAFISLRTKGDRVQKTYFFDPSEELLALPHEVVQQ